MNHGRFVLLMVLLCLIAGCSKVRWMPGPRPAASPGSEPASPPAAIVPPADEAMVQAVLHGKGYVSDVAARNALSFEMWDLLERHRFADVEDEILEFQKDRSKFSPSEFAASWAYTALELPNSPYQSSYDQLISVLKDWTQEGDSVSLLALGTALNGKMHYWDEANAGKDALDQDVRLSSQVLHVALSRNPTDPDTNTAILQMACNSTYTKNPVSQWLAAATSRNPAYLPAWEAEGFYMVPRMGNANPEQFEAMTQQAGRVGGDALYTQVILATFFPWTVEHMFKDIRIDWPRMRQGFIELDRRMPGSAGLLNFFCHCACAAQDAPTARALFDRLQDRWLRMAWNKRRDFDRARDWAYRKATAEQAAASGVPEAPVRTVWPLGREASYPVTDYCARGQFQYDVQETWEQGHWRDLDRMAEILREHPKDLAPGRNLMLFYDRVAPGDFNDDASYEAALKSEEEWLQATDSLTARVARAHVLIDYAWHARGGGYANTVKSEGWRLFDERLKKADAELEAAARMPGSDKDEGVWSALLRVGLGLSWPASRMDELVEKANRANPYSLQADETRVWSLLPRWFGQPGDSTAFIARVSDPLDDDHRDATYALLAFDLMTSLGADKEFWDMPWSWERIKKGFRDLMRRKPEELIYPNMLARMAFEKRDRQTAAPLFEKLGRDGFVPRLWNQRNTDPPLPWQEFRKARLWAQAGQPRALPITSGIYRKVGDRFEHESTTDVVARKLGVTFGCNLDVRDFTPSQPKKVTFIWRHPPIHLPQGRQETESVHTIGFTPTTVELLAFWTFDYPYEMVPGKWSLRILIDGKEVWSRTFRVE